MSFSRTSAVATLSDTEKYNMAMELLAEFRAENISEHGDEIHHSCVLPFGLHAHGDRSASASLNWRKLSYNCFVCGGGGLFWFVSNCRGETMGSVRDWADSKTAGLDGEDSLASLLTYLDGLYNPESTSTPPMPHFNPAVLEPWKLIHPYLTDMRHISEDNIVKHSVGYDASIDRIVFPLWWKDQLVGWQTRRIIDDGTPKYKNTPDFPRDRVIYNGEVKAQTLVVVESPITVVSKTHFEPEYGFMATFGAQVTDRQLHLLSSHEEIVLWFDNDSAGWKATSQVAETLLNYMDVFVVPSPYNEDAGGLDDDTTRQLLSEAVPYSLWTPPKVVEEWSRPC